MDKNEIVYTVEGTPIHAVRAGKIDRQIALLVHGWSSSSFALEPLMDLLSYRFHCIAVDLPGYGKSPQLPDRTTISKYVDLLANLLEGISDGPVVLVGHSMGGMISLKLALEHPALIERMVLISPTITGILSRAINMFISPITLLERFGLGRFIVSIVERTFIGLTDRLMRPVSFAERSAITKEDYHRLRKDARQSGQGRVRAECFFSMRANDLQGQLSSLVTPALVIWGAEDNTVPLTDAGILAEEWPTADLRILPKAGHWPHFENPSVTLRLIAHFLGLPLFSDFLHPPVDDEELARINAVANFLAHSDIGNQLDLVQRTRLSAQLQQRKFGPFINIIDNESSTSEMYIVMFGTIEVWQDPENPGPDPQQPKRVAILKPGQMTGELSMLDQGLRTADLITGSDGAVILALSRENLQALTQDDPVLGTQLMWNLATSMSHRVRFILWQLQRVSQRAAQKQHSGRIETSPADYR